MQRRKLALVNLAEVESARAEVLVAAAAEVDAWWQGVAGATVTPDAVAYLLSVDDLDAGVVAVRRVGDVAVVRVFVAPDQRRTGAARAAIGRILGERRWPDIAAYVAPVAEPDAATDALLGVTGFSRIWRDRAGEVWVRSAPPARYAKDDPRRFLDAEGRIDRYPERPRERETLLRWVAAAAFVSDGVLTEKQVGDALLAYAPGGDVAVLRRYLVDLGLLERTASGSEYRASTPGSDQSG